MESESNAPWTPAEVQSLNAFQESGVFHGFTSHDGIQIIATEHGWVCPCGCEYIQTWAWKWMTDGTWEQFRSWQEKEYPT